MSIANEPSSSQLENALKSGLIAIDRNQTINFQQYNKVVLAQDGYVFWVRSGIPIAASGSLHYSTDRVQEEDQTIGINSVVFTSENEITQFNSISPTLMYIGTWQVGTVSIQIAFSRRGSYYQQANVWHYSGYAVYPALYSQIINSPGDLPLEPIVSNSLPIWLTQNSIAPVFPSFLVPDNVTPPYIICHIDPKLTKAIGPFPIKGSPGVIVASSDASPLYLYPTSQLMQDTVKLTFYGLTNQQIIQYYNSLVDYSLNTDNFGFCGQDPTIVDEKRTQVEIASIAMKKTLTLDASYYQGTSDAIARRLLLTVGEPTPTLS